MPIIENEPSLTDIMNELKSFKKETNARLDSVENDIKKIDTKLNNVIKLNDLKV